MAADSDQERTEEATLSRREDFRKRGQVAQTRELASVMTLFGGILLILVGSKFFYNHIALVFERTLNADFRDDNLLPIITFAYTQAFYLVIPAFLVFGVFSFFSTVLQIGFLNNEEALKFDFNKINPLTGLGRMFSLRSVVEGIKAVGKVCLVIAVVYLIVQKELTLLPATMQMSSEAMMVLLGSVSVKMLGGAGAMMLVIAAFDYGYQRFDLENKMKMTKQEVKEEHKTREGDPMIKARIRRIQREMAQKRMMADVPKADVIITNPTHIAIALIYNSETPAPKVIAKGADAIAEKIKLIARENNIPVIENKPLARAIFKTIDIGQIIPRELYQAVAEVLSYVFRLKKRKKV